MPTQDTQAATTPAETSARAELPAPSAPETAHAELTGVALATREEGHVQIAEANVTYKVDGVSVTTTHAVLPVRELPIGTIVVVAHKIVRNNVEETKKQTYVTAATRSVKSHKDSAGNTYKIDGYRVYAIRSIKVVDDTIEVAYVGKQIVDNMRPTVSSHADAYATWVPIQDIVNYTASVKVAYPKPATAAASVVRGLLA
jgi:hypothetical protein